jgi:hypothetical protein
MTLPFGDYVYEMRSDAALIAIEETRLEQGKLSGRRISADGANVHRVVATIDADSQIERIESSYARGPFARSVIYELSGEMLSGTLVAMGSRDTVQTKLGRFREIDADLLLFKALIITHISARGLDRYTGRVAVIDSATLVASSPKLTYWRHADSPTRWTVETLIGDREQLETDPQGRIIKRVDSRRVETILSHFQELVA